ncbi:MAG: hypothetical protein ACE5RN_07685 [Nitrosopumilaceae archaeon]
MDMEEIEIPKELGSFILDKAEETSLGQKNGAKKQYRYKNLHIREYDDKFLVHTDKADPRNNALAHLVLDAPEVLIGLASAIIGGGKVASYFKKNNKSPVVPSVLASLLFGYLGFSLTKKIKNL